MLAYTQDLTSPDKPDISYVTIDTATNNTVIYWTPSDSTDVEWYVISRETITPNGPEGIIIDSVSADQLSYIHEKTEAVNQSYIYSIYAKDSSGNKSLRTPGLHSTVHTNLLYDSCQNTITISWNKYMGWNENVSGYIVYWKSGKNTFQILDGVGFNDSLYIHRNIDENITFSYFVEALNYDGLISRSNIISKFTYMPSPPEELILDLVTISGENEAEIQFHSTDTVYGFSLLRSSVATSDFESVHQFYNENQSNYDRQGYILHDFILSKSEKFFYKIGSLNTCLQIDSIKSNLGVNILLKGIYNEEYISLNWNKYQEWELGVEEYQLFRLDESGQNILLRSFDQNSTSYIDYLGDAANINLSGEIIYQIKAKKTNEDVYSISNPLIMKVTSDLHMPNAFTPNGDGENDLFQPIIRFSPDKYTMIIYDRSGIPLFQSNNINNGWDGTINGKGMAPQGVYMYHIQYTSFSGTKKSETGTLTLFYP